MDRNIFSNDRCFVDPGRIVNAFCVCGLFVHQEIYQFCESKIGGFCIPGGSFLYPLILGNNNSRGIGLMDFIRIFFVGYKSNMPLLRIVNAHNPDYLYGRVTNNRTAYVFSEFL